MNYRYGVMITIDKNACNSCGICEHVCPRHIPETLLDEGEKQTVISEQRTALCMTCGHCTAVCPTNAIHLDIFDSKKFMPVRKTKINPDEILVFMKQRRSVRRYKGAQQVSREHLDQIIEAAGCAPTGTGSLSTGAIIITDPDTLSKLSNLCFEVYEDLDKALKNPIIRWIIRLRLGKPLFHSLLEFVMPGMRWYIKWHQQGKSNEILRDAKAIILFTSPLLEPMGNENCFISGLQAIFMAETLGVGTCFNDLIPQACNRDKRLRGLLKLPDDMQVHTSLTLGYPKYRFQRIVPRHFANVRYLD